MRRQVPSLRALLAFESAARHESFTKAAQELGITQSAVCRRITGLEEELNTELFARLPRGVRLTEVGVSYSRHVTQRLDDLERDALSVMARSESSVTIELAVMPTFATRWLLPRLHRFHARHPNTRINLTTQTRPFLFAGSGFDAALYFGLAGWPGTEATFLMPERSFPVCAPSLMGARDRLEPEEIATLPLIQQSTRPHAWRDWFAARGLTVAHDMTGSRFELFSMSAQAAMLGAGVALVPPLLIEEELKSGRLRMAHPEGHLDEKAYHFIVPEKVRTTAILDPFRKWLVEEASPYRID